MTGTSELSLIIPAYNEVRRIGSTLEAVRTFLDVRDPRYEVLVYADGDDGTRERARELGSRAASFGAAIEARQPLHRRLGSHAFGLGMHLTLGLWDIVDTQCGFKVFTAGAARDLLGDIVVRVPLREKLLALAIKV